MDSNLAHDFELFMQQRIYITHLWSSWNYTRGWQVSDYFASLLTVDICNILL